MSAAGHYDGIVGIQAVLAATPTEVDAWAGTDYTQCKCRIHVKPVFSEDQAGGCLYDDHGTHHAVAALYAPGGPVTFCHATPGQRRLDQQFAQLLVDYSGGAAANLSVDGYEPARRFETGNFLPVKALGAGFCYSKGLRGCVRMRAARVVGSVPLVGDALRLVCVVGVAKSKPFRVIRVAEGRYHLDVDERGVETEKAGFYLAGALVKALREGGPYSRIGASLGDFEKVMAALQTAGCDVSGGGASSSSAKGTSGKVDSCVPVVPGMGTLFGVVQVSLRPNVYSTYVDNDRMAGLRGWLAGAGVYPVKASWVDLAVSSMAVSSTPGSLLPLKSRVALMAVLGDIVMKQVAVLRVLSDARTMPDYVRSLKAQENLELARVAHEFGLVSHLAIGALQPRSKGVADMVEAVIGVVAYFCGVDEVRKLLEHLKLLPSKRSEAKNIDLTWSTAEERASEIDPELLRQFLAFQAVMKSSGGGAEKSARQYG